MLQELGHDLRTPLASLQNIIERLSLRKDSMDSGKQNELFSLALQEQAYMRRLLEDLFFIAQPKESTWRIVRKSISWPR